MSTPRLYECCKHNKHAYDIEEQELNLLLLRRPVYAEAERWFKAMAV